MRVDVGGNRYDDPVLMRRIGELTAKASEVLNVDRTAVDQVAMVVNEKSLCYLRPGDPLGAWLLVQQIPALSQIGHLWDTILSLMCRESLTGRSSC